MSKLKDYLINTLFLIVLCTLIIGIYYSIKYQIANGHTKEVVSEVVAFVCVVGYIIALFLSLIFSDKCKFASIISAILYFPIQLLRIILPWYQQIMYFLFAVVFPAGLGVFILRIISSLGEYNLSNELIYFVSYTLSAILASNHRFGDLIIKITLSKKLFKERAKVSAEYDVKAIRYLIYLIYFVFLFIGYFRSFYYNIDSFPKEVSASFLVYIAFDRLVANKHLVTDVNQKVKKSLIEQIKS